MTETAKYEMRPIDQQIISQSEAAWSTVTDPDIFESECRATFEWALEHLDYARDDSNVSCAYGVFSDNDMAVEAIVEVVSRRALPSIRGQTKLLRVIVSPRYWVDGDRRSDIVSLFLSSITGTIRLSGEAGSRIVKLYGRSEGLLSLLHSVRNALERNAAEIGISCDMRGRWLQIEVPGRSS